MIQFESGEEAVAVVEDRRLELHERISYFIAREFLIQKGFDLNFDMDLISKKVELEQNFDPEETYLRIHTTFTVAYPKSYTGVVKVEVWIHWQDVDDLIRLVERGEVTIIFPNHNDFSSAWYSLFELFFEPKRSEVGHLRIRTHDRLKFVDIPIFPFTKGR